MESELKETMWLGSCSFAPNQITMQYGYEDYKFNCVYWYSDIDLLSLSKLYGKDFMEKLIFHQTAFEANKLISLKPKYFSLGPFEKFYTKEFEEFWSYIAQRIWGQFRFQNDCPEYKGPKIIIKNNNLPLNQIDPISYEQEKTDKYLLFCGGGKDSLLCAKLLEKIGCNYDIYCYACSFYGKMEEQHEFVEVLLKKLNYKKKISHWVFDDFMESPILSLMKLPYKELIAGETPSSLFGAIPITLAIGYKYTVVGHEKSADTGNLQNWGPYNEEINHQWGKSLEAELLINNYIRKHLVKNYCFFSLLKPVFDTGIFSTLDSLDELIQFTDSCNMKKPWCLKCPKCIYVWLGFLCYCKEDIVMEMFKNKNLFEIKENLQIFEMLIGKGGRTPFECIGKKEESQICMEICRKRGFKGVAIEKSEEFIIENQIDVKKEIEKHFIYENLNTEFYPKDVDEKLKAIIMENLDRKKSEFFSLLDK